MDDATTASLRDADHRLVRTVDGLSDEQLAAPSLLPGWTRAHVVAHLALNAEALDDGGPRPARRGAGAHVHLVRGA